MLGNLEEINTFLRDIKTMETKSKRNKKSKQTNNKETESIIKNLPTKKSLGPKWLSSNIQNIRENFKLF